MNRSKIIQALSGFRWQGVPGAGYSPDSTRHRGIVRQTLLGDHVEEASQSALRYFEIEPGGYSSLERHVHEHIVIVIRGEGHVVLGEAVRKVSLHDCIYVASNAIHQLHATSGSTLGFFCFVDRVRDRPIAPTSAEIEVLAGNPEVAALMKI